jgi:serine/threonine-protein kinase
VGLPADLLAQVPRRLTVGGIGSAVLFSILLATEPFRPAEAAGHWMTISGEAIAIVLSLVVARFASTGRLSPSALTDLAVLFHVSIGFVIWVIELAVPFGTTTHTPGIPTVAGWVLFFPVLVPLPIRSAAMAGVIVSLMGPLVLVAYIAAGQPAPQVGHAILWFIAAAFPAGMAVITSGVLQRAVSDLRRARERDSYVLLQRIGHGGMGEVWTARHERLARVAAVKTIRTDVSPEALERMQRRFELEARITASLRSPHTVELYDYGVSEDGAMYFAMELLDGVDLDALVRRHGPVPPERVVHVLMQACDSLAEAHDRGFVHRDIKPSNLMVCRLGNTTDFVKVLDFGMVKPSKRHDESMLTRPGAYVGTPAYAAPEALLGEFGPRADLFALGCVAWWLLTGRHRFHGIVGSAARREAIAKTQPVGEASPHDVPDALAALIDSCLAFDPAERPADAATLRDALGAVPLDPWTRERADSWWATHQRLDTRADETQDVTTLAVSEF